MWPRLLAHVLQAILQRGAGMLRAEDVSWPMHQLRPTVSTCHIQQSEMNLKTKPNQALLVCLVHWLQIPALT